MSPSWKPALCTINSSANNTLIDIDDHFSSFKKFDIPWSTILSSKLWRYSIMKRANLLDLSISDIKFFFKITCNSMLAYSELYLQSNLILDFRNIEKIISTHDSIVNNLSCTIMKFLEASWMCIVVECNIRINNFLIDYLSHSPICNLHSWSNSLHVALTLVVESMHLF